ncbi:lactoylglutathione lyase [Fusarium globosum]|uniref:Lactoylglutathione lyase n=1 Tax=Fusarium globosum TaxID=78864 RepID=A0A8H5Y834_9HYPO|nr:lactoylglutathione lyase [Fusarium globosum]
MSRNFENRQFVRRQILDANQVQKLALTLHRPSLGGFDIQNQAPPNGTPLPPGYHLVYFTPGGLESELGADGTDTSFNAPFAFTRRMWGGGRIEWAASSSFLSTAGPELRVGDEVEEATSLISATPKESRSAGEMVLVEVKKEYHGPRGLALTDYRSWIFRPEIKPLSRSSDFGLLVDADPRQPTLVRDESGRDGYKLNHFMMRIRDPKKSMEFYTKLMGMRTVFVLNAGPFTVYYLGYPQTDEHRVDLTKFAIDTITNLPHTLGLLELFHIHGSEKQQSGFYSTGNTPPNLGFGHLGFTVPNVSQALMRLRAQGVPVLKDIGPCEAPILISDWEKQRGVGVSVKGTDSELHPGYAKLLEQIAFIQDPYCLHPNVQGDAKHPEDMQGLLS